MVIVTCYYFHWMFWITVRNTSSSCITQEVYLIALHCGMQSVFQNILHKTNISCSEIWLDTQHPDLSAYLSGADCVCVIVNEGWLEPEPRLRLSHPAALEPEHQGRTSVSRHNRLLRIWDTNRLRTDAIFHAHPQHSFVLSLLSSLSVSCSAARHYCISSGSVSDAVNV